MLHSTKNKPNGSFSLFPRLPIELQYCIWELCIPARIIELDVQGTDILETTCSLQLTSLINVRPPIITRVCQASRKVALQAGIRKLRNNSNEAPEWYAMNDMRDQWVIPSTDILHLNYCNAYDGWYNASGNPLQVLIWLAREKYQMQMSIVAPLMIGLDDYVGAEFACGFVKHLELLAQGGGPYLVTLCVVSLHVDLNTAMQAEGGMLFGRLGEERVKLVAARDEAALRAYCNLWAVGPATDKEPASFFDLAVHRHHSEWLSRVAHWQRRLSTMWVKHCSAKAERNQEFGNIAHPEGIWRELENTDGCFTGTANDNSGCSDFMRPQPPPSGTFPGPMYVANECHEWAAEILRDMPKFEPMVMFRLCEDKCCMPKSHSTRWQASRRGRGHLGRG
ncbi:hypothetical protein N7456_007857 [Penicillium angulare]|uniref:2EXR domain-containing protein n=1 Tax=Penicillium angulare TaxID=116970 RepID=A0A9W9FBM1_9EURO|nr:hypothetical protein N7456_007857 [Penicillium angulare]